MKKGDFIWAGLLLAFTAFVVFPSTHEVFVTFTSGHPYISGFIKFALLATMGEMLVTRLNTKQWKTAPGFIWRVIIWGALGMVITLAFTVFSGGISIALDKGLLPGKGNAFFQALFASAFMNLIFAPTFMAFHRYTDTFIDLKYGEGVAKPSIAQVAGRIDWKGFISFVVLKTIPFFWIPAHTITFMLPPQYRVLVAAYLSIALGLLLTIAKGRK